jgi:tetratricopeptide (TPR) repeat protein
LGSLDRALEVAERLDDPNKILFASQQRGELTARSGDWGQAHAALERATLIARRHGMAHSLVDCLIRLGWLCLYEGRWPEADCYLDESVALADQLGERFPLQRAQHCMAERDLLAGQPERACARIVPLLDAIPVADPLTDLERFGVSLWVRVAWAHLERGEGTQAAELVDAALRRLRVHPEPEEMLEALRVQAMVQVRSGHWIAAAEALAEGLALARTPSYPRPFYEGCFLHVWGQMHLKRGEPVAAREQLEAARAIFQRLGAHLLLARVEEDLAALDVEAPARGQPDRIGATLKRSTVVAMKAAPGQ